MEIFDFDLKLICSTDFVYEVCLEIVPFNNIIGELRHAVGHDYRGLLLCVRL